MCRVPNEVRNMNEKHRKVQSWLEEVFLDEEIPQYEINERNLETIIKLMQKNKERNRDAQIILADLNQKTTEYEAEAKRLSQILESVGLSTPCLSQSGSVSLRTLARVATILEIKDVTTSSYLLQMSNLTQSMMETQSEHCTETKQNEQLFTKTKAAFIKASSLKRALDALEDQSQYAGPELEKKVRTTGFLHNKIREYATKRQQLKDQLNENGFSDSLSHQSLVKEAEYLGNLKAKLAPLKSKLDSYHCLPPNVSLTKVKIEEAKQELESLEAELARNIDAMRT
ncbi:HAUS augmin-like complex subunit 1 [Anneissia japonica]|uniref:HAUS augmin-like complex subunit 1 n=1 Tax=Anneissia japonica TaxID=1529436 RepID=UPI001425A74F|nr:HAUS augmin-like complex subunit 1 [Anneissia japonica]